MKPNKSAIDKLFAVRDAAYTAAPGLKNLFPQLAETFQGMFTQGAHELGAALFTGNAFVLYGHHGSKEQSPMEAILNPPAKEQTEEQNRQLGRDGPEI